MTHLSSCHKSKLLNGTKVDLAYPDAILDAEASGVGIFKHSLPFDLPEPRETLLSDKSHNHGRSRQGVDKRFT